MGSIKSPWANNKVGINKTLGSSIAASKLKKASKTAPWTDLDIAHYVELVKSGFTTKEARVMVDKDKQKP